MPTASYNATALVKATKIVDGRLEIDGAANAILGIRRTLCGAMMGDIDISLSDDDLVSAQKQVRDVIGVTIKWDKLKLISRFHPFHIIQFQTNRCDYAIIDMLCTFALGCNWPSDVDIATKLIPIIRLQVEQLGLVD